MIKSFLYLDSQKLRSVSSQIFEGVADHVIHSEKERKQELEEQKGSFTSGRLIGDIFATEKSSSELRSLEDHAYTLFENELENSRLLTSASNTSNTSRTDMSFVKVTGNLRINDVGATNRLLEKFNEIGEAITRAGLMAQDATGSSGKTLSDNDVKKAAMALGMQMDAKLVKSLRTLISFGLNDVIEASIVDKESLFTSPLKKDFLRESAEMILYKYSRVTQQQFSMVGLITQRGSLAQAEEALPDVKDADGVKMAMRTLSLHMRTVEQFFLGPLSNEMVVDPIAIYTTV